MLKVNINKKEVEIEDSSLKTFGDLMKKISERFLDDSFITKVSLNGKELTKKEEMQNYSLDNDKVKFLEIETTSLDDMKNRGFFLIEEYLKKMVEQMERTSETLRVGDEVEANQLYAVCIEDLKLLINLIEDISFVLNVDFNQIEFEGFAIQTRLDKFSYHIREMILSQENSDWVMLADLIEYELIPLLQEWRDIMIFLKKNF